MPLKAPDRVARRWKDEGDEDWFLIRGERKGGDTPLPRFFHTFPPKVDTPSVLQSYLREGSDIYGRAPTAKANIMSFRGSVHIILPLFACGEE